MSRNTERVLKVFYTGCGFSYTGVKAYKPQSSRSRMAAIHDLKAIDIRVGKIVDVHEFSAAKNPSYKLKIDFGPGLGIKKSCAQLKANYTKEQLQGKLVLAVVNFPAMQVGPTISEVLTLGVPDANGNCILITPDKDASIGGRLY